MKKGSHGVIFFIYLIMLQLCSGGSRCSHLNSDEKQQGQFSCIITRLCLLQQLPHGTTFLPLHSRLVRVNPGGLWFCIEAALVAWATSDCSEYPESLCSVCCVAALLSVAALTHFLSLCLCYISAGAKQKRVFTVDADPAASTDEMQSAGLVTQPALPGWNCLYCYVMLSEDEQDLITQHVGLMEFHSHLLLQAVRNTLCVFLMTF